MYEKGAWCKSLQVQRAVHEEFWTIAPPISSVS